MSDLLNPIVIECGDPEAPTQYEFVCRKPTAHEAARYLDTWHKSQSTTQTINFIKTITKSVNGQTGSNALALIDEMASGSDGYEDIANEALFAAGYPKANSARILAINTKTSADEIEKWGLPSNCVELLKDYKAPRALRAIQFDGFPAVILVTPSVAHIEAKEKASRESIIRGLSDLGASCTVWPALAERQEIWKAHPGLASQLGIEALQMRDAIKGREKKG